MPDRLSAQILFNINTNIQLIHWFLNLDKSLSVIELFCDIKQKLNYLFVSFVSYLTRLRIQSSSHCSEPFSSRSELSFLTQTFNFIQFKLKIRVKCFVRFLF